MSARNWIFERLTGACISSEEANKALDDFLHEEAEEVRDALDPNRNLMFPNEFEQGMDTAADLIDPYAK